MKGILFIFSTLILLGACTIEKRLHNPGYNIQWNKVNRKSTDESTVKIDTKEINIRFEESSDQEQEVSELMINETIDSITLVETSSEIEIVKVDATTVTPKIHQSITYKTTSSQDLKRVNPNPVLQNESSKLSRKIDWGLIGLVALGLLILAVFGVALFGTGALGTIATIASVLIAIGGIVLLIVAIIFLCSLFWAIFFGWWI
jgi:hypothetical protein